MKVKWLDNTLIVGPFLCLIKTKEELISLYERGDLDIPDPLPFDFSSEMACTLTFDQNNGEQPIAAVCVGDFSKHNNSEIAGLIAHEASHVIDAYFEYIGEKTPSSEFKAYSIQTTVEKLMKDLKRKRK